MYFKHDVNLIARCFMYSSDAILFSAPCMPHARLKPVRFTNIVPRVRFAPLIRDNDQAFIVHDSLAYKINLTIPAKEAFAIGAQAS